MLRASVTCGCLPTQADAQFVQCSETPAHLRAGFAAHKAGQRAGDLQPAAIDTKRWWVSQHGIR